MRFDSPLQLFERTATADVQIGGVTVREGQQVAALLGAANRDPAVFPDPDVLDVGRTDNPHITFGAGVHFCIGAPLARVELQASFGALLERTSRLELGGEPGRRPELDRKSTRLNSSHANISYAVFCLKKKNKKKENSFTSTASANARQPHSSMHATERRRRHTGRASNAGIATRSPTNGLLR